MKKSKLRLQLLSSFLVLSLLLGMAQPAFAFIGNNRIENTEIASANATPQPQSSPNTDTNVDYRNLSLNPGAVVEEMRFTWHSRFEQSTLVIENPNGENWELSSQGRPAVAHGGFGTMGADSNLLPTRPGYDYFVHQVAVYDLTAATEYTYFIQWDSGRSENKTFRTGGSDNFQFLIAGDPQIGVGDGLSPTGTTEATVDGRNWESTLDIATDAFPNSDFILSVGDQVHSANSVATNPNAHVAISQYRHDRMFSHEALHSMPLMAVSGNHDGWTFDNNNANIRLWPMHYNIPAPDTVGARGGRHENVFRHRGDLYTQFDYWVRWGDTLFFVLDSNGGNDGQHRVMNGERLAFLEDAVAQNADATWKVATFHHPAFSVYRITGIPEKTQIINNFLPHLERLDFDIVLNGHAHSYSRSHHMIGSVPQHDQQFLDEEGNIVNEATNSVLDPEGIAHIDFNSASGSGFYNVAAMPRSYIATYNQNFRRNFSVVDVTPHTFSVRTYQLNNDNSRSLVDVYTMVQGDENGNVPSEVTRLPQVDDQTFERITQPEPVSVPHGTPATVEGFGLPETVGIETNLFNNVGGDIASIRPPNAAAAPYSYGTVVRTPRAAVTWDIEGSDFDPNEVGLQQFSVRGTVAQLPSNILNVGDIPLYTYVDVTVLPAGIVQPGYIARWMQYNPQSPHHPYGMEAYFIAAGGGNGANARVPAISSTYGEASPLRFFVGETNRSFNWSAGAPTVLNAAGTAMGGLNNLTEDAFWHTSFSTLGRAGVEVEFNFRSDPAGAGNLNNGPRDWQLEFSLNNEDWVAAGAPITLTGFWQNNLVRTLPDIANDQEVVYLRWRLASDIAVGGGAISATARNHMRDIRIRSTRPLHDDGTTDDGYQRIDVLMFNDFHGHVEGNEPVPDNPGAARLAAFIEHQRNQNPNPNNVIVVGGGDEFHGYAVSTQTDGKPALALYGYLAENSPAQQESGIHIAFGNHEFSFGYQRAREIGHHPNVTLLAADLYYAPNRPGTRPDFVEPFDIVEFPDHDISVALVGLMTSTMQNVVSGWGTMGLEARTPAPNNPDEYTEAVANLIEYLREERGVDAVVGVTHMGGNHASTTYIAENLDFDGIVGGHVHSRVHRRVNDTPIIEASHSGRALGRFSLVFDENHELQRVDSWLSEAGEVTQFTRPVAAMNGVADHYDNVAALMAPYFEQTYEELRGPRGPYGVYFSNRAERDVWVSRLVVDYVARWAEQNGEPTDWIGISNGGGWRNTGFWPRNADDQTTMAELISTMPFDNNILLFQMHGQDVLSLINAPGLTGTQIRAGIHQDGENWYVTATGERIENNREQVFNVIGSNFIFGGIGANGGDNYPWPGNTRGNEMGMEVLDENGPRVIMQNGDAISWNELLAMSNAPTDWEGLGVSMLRTALLRSTEFRANTPSEAWQAELTVSASSGGTAQIEAPFAPGNRTRNVNIAPQWVRVAASANEGYSFVGWYEGETLLSEELQFGFTITENTALEARFAPNDEGEEPIEEVNERITLAAWASGNLTTSHGYETIDTDTFPTRWNENDGLSSMPTGNTWLNFIDDNGPRALVAGSGGINASNTLAEGNHWLTEISTVGRENIQVDWSFRSTNTGPRDFQLQYRTANGEWSNADEPIVVVNAGGNPANINVASHFSRTLPTTAEGHDNLQLRWVIASGTAVNGNPIAAGGTHQIGNIRISAYEVEVEEQPPVDEALTDALRRLEELLTYVDNLALEQANFTTES